MYSLFMKKKILSYLDDEYNEISMPTFAIKKHNISRYFCVMWMMFS